MRRASVIGLVLAIAMTVVAPQVAAARERPGDPTKPDITIGQAAPGLRYQFPGAVALADGTILVVVRQGLKHSSPDGSIVLYRSPDGGTTWSAPRVIFDSPGDDRDPKLSRTADGRVFLHLFISDPGQVGADIGDFVLRSDDHGENWSAPSRVHSSMVWAASHGEITQAPDGTLLAPIYGPVPGVARWRASVVRSVDGGLTWPVENEIFLPHVDGQDVVEPVLTVLPNGSITALLRVGAVAGKPRWEQFSLITRSQDGGRTWTAPEPTSLVTSSAETLVLRNGDVFVAFGDLSNRFGLRRLTSAAVIKNPYRPWVVEATSPVWDAFVDDQANPAILETRPGRVTVFGFDYSNRTLVATNVNVRDVGAKTDAEQLRGRMDLSAMVQRGAATIDTTLDKTEPATTLAGPTGAIDGLLGLNHAALGTTVEGSYTVTFARPHFAWQIGIALRPGEAQPAVVQARGYDGVWREVGSLDERFRYGDVDWLSVPWDKQIVTAIRVTTKPMAGPRPPNSGGTKPVAISEIAVRGF